MQKELGLIPSDIHYFLRLDYNEELRKYSFETLTYTKPIEYTDVLKKLFTFEKGKRTIVDLFIPRHACLLISEKFKNPITQLYEDKIIFYNPNSAVVEKYRDIRVFIDDEYKRITGNRELYYRWIESDKINEQYNFSIQRGPTCQLYSYKLWLLTILNPEIPTEILIDYSYNQSNNIEKQYLLTFYSSLFFIELFFKYFPTFANILWSKAPYIKGNWHKEIKEYTFSEVINKIFESYI